MKVDISCDFVLDLRFVNSFHSFNLKLLCILATQNFIVTNEYHPKFQCVSVNFTTNKLSELAPNRFGKQEGFTDPFR